MSENSDNSFMNKFIFNKNFLVKTACVFSITVLSLLTSCVTLTPRQTVSRKIADRGIKNSEQLYSFFMAKNPSADKKQIMRMAGYYVEEAAAEGINSDVAFIQMCLETNYLRFGNLVSADMHNYCGLGAMDEEHRGEIFKTERLGVRAHIQHLHAYGTTEGNTLNNELIDKRYKWVRPRGKAPTIYELAGTWAMDKEYGVKLNRLLGELEGF